MSYTYSFEVQVMVPATVTVKSEKKLTPEEVIEMAFISCEWEAEEPEARDVGYALGELSVEDLDIEEEES